MNKSKKLSAERGGGSLDRVINWRRSWSIYAGLHAFALLFLMLAKNWAASWFCVASIYYCLLARWREGKPANDPDPAAALRQ